MLAVNIALGSIETDRAMSHVQGYSAILFAVLAVSNASTQHSQNCASLHSYSICFVQLEVYTLIGCLRESLRCYILLSIYLEMHDSSERLSKGKIGLDPTT